MGLEATCTARWRDQASSGKARLEEKRLVFGGTFRLAIPLAEVQSAEAKRGALILKFPGGPATFHLGTDAEKWALKIRYPRPLLEKLGVKAGLRVALLGVEEESFRRQLREGSVGFADGKAEEGSELIFFAAENREALGRLKLLERSLAKTGAIWVVYPKGQKRIAQADVMAAAKAAGLVDVKVVSFSDTHTALKLVIPLSRR